MITTMETDDEALRSALRAARQNAERWMEMYPETCADSEGLEQWRSIARLRRQEVERLEALAVRMSEPGGTSYAQAGGGNAEAARP